MRSGVVHEALTAIDEAEEGARLDLDYRVVASLKEKGLVSAYSRWFYQEMVSSAAELKKLGKRLKETQDEVTGYESGIKYFEKCLGSSWGYTKKELQDMREQLEDRRCKREERSRTAERLESKVERLEAMPAPAEGYRLTIDGDYVMLTEKGELVKAHLSGRLPELDDIVLEDTIRELEGFQTRVDAQYSRFTEMLDLMLKAGFQKEYDVIDCAVRLSTIKGPVQEVYSRMRVINDYFHKLGYPVFKDYNRLIPTFAAAKQDGDIEARKEEIIETYRELVKKRYYKNSFTWWLAAEVMNLGRLGGRIYPWIGIEIGIESYNKVRNALATEGWENRKRHTDYMAATLARRHDSPEVLARNLRIQQQRLASTGRVDGGDLDFAALILLDSGASLEERTDRFVKAFEEMAASGWQKHSNFYPAAAAISLLPGSAAENVLWLDKIIKRLKADGFADRVETREGHKGGLTYRALPLLMAAYKGQFGQDVMPRFITHYEDSFFFQM